MPERTRESKRTGKRIPPKQTPKQKNPYGNCPVCGELTIGREKGWDRCKQGHHYESALAGDKSPQKKLSEAKEKLDGVYTKKVRTRKRMPK